VTPRKYDPGKHSDNGRAVNPLHCVAYVWSTFRGSQCEKRRKDGTRDNEWCGMHCPDRYADREAAKRAARHAERERRYAAQIESRRAPYMEAVAAFDAWEASGDKYSLRDALVALADKAEEEVGTPWWKD
jgi:hypothetical protein